MNQNIYIEDELNRLKTSFPKAMESELVHLLLMMKINSKHNAYWGYKINLEGHILEIPSRIYWELDNLRYPSNIPHNSLLILSCILTRHCDGFVREKYLYNLISSNSYWTIPYLIQLIGEYVVEILDLIWEIFDAINHIHLKNFIKENDLFWFKTKQRIMSYWNCYHRYKNQSKDDYVGFRLIKRIEEII